MAIRFRIRHTPRVLDRIAEGLENLREYGFAQITIEARILTASRDVFEKAVSRWEVLPSERPQSTEPETKVDNGVSSTTEKSAPLWMAILEDPQVKKVIEACQLDARFNVIFCPKVTVFNGQHATIQDTVQTPFVVAISSDGKPTIRVVESGTKIQLRAIWKGGHIRLESQVTLSDIRKVDVMNLPGQAGGESSPKVQVPEVATTRINNTVKLPSDGSVLLGGLNLPNEDRVPAGRSLFDRLGLTTPPEIPEQQWFIVLRVVHLEHTPEILPAPAKQIPADSVPPVESQPLKRTPHSSLPYHDQDLIGTGVNSDAGVSGTVRLDEKNLPTSQSKLPTKAEVLEAVRKQCRQKNLREPKNIDPQSVKVITEIVDRWTEPQRFYPMIGLAREHRVRFKCTVKMEETVAAEWPILAQHTRPREHVVYVEKTQLVIGEPMVPASNASEKDEGQILPSAYYLADDVQYFPGVLDPPKKNTPASWEELKRDRSKTKTKSEEEQRIEKALSQKITLQFDKTSLSEVATQIARQAGVNVVLDKLGIVEEGVTAEEQITIHVENITLNSALRLILKPLHLAFCVEDEVLKITSETRVKGPLEVITYPVADLVVPIPQRVSLDLREKSSKHKSAQAEAAEKTLAMDYEKMDFENLLDLIATTIEPNSWAENGGSGSMRIYETTLSIVVRQQEPVHEKIRTLLEQLRRLQDVQISLDIRTIEAEQLADEALMKKLGPGKRMVLAPEKAAALIQSVQNDRKATLRQLPKVTLFNGQTLNLITDAAALDFSPASTADRRFVRLSIHAKADAKPILNSLLTVKDGQSVLWDVSKLTGRESTKRTWMLVTPKIIVQEEEEELLGVSPN